MIAFMPSRQVSAGFFVYTSAIERNPITIKIPKTVRTSPKRLGFSPEWALGRSSARDKKMKKPAKAAFTISSPSAATVKVIVLKLAGRKSKLVRLSPGNIRRAFC